ncbi:MAG: hypothetical protein NPIRA01_39780 [Nitrospirales bacterium]|nr:MAG: hypothetical protein NPIRA01_39780 [Nitrospirales bacterium]
MPHLNLSLAMFFFLSFTVARSTWAQLLPTEPEEDYLVNEDVNIVTGLYTREYSLQQDGRVDYKTARQIIISEYNEYWNSVVTTKEFPLFYWIDADHDGEFNMYVDQQVEGRPSDIVPYTPLSSSSEP